MKQAVLVALGGLTLFWLVAVGPMCWMLRDGLGPDSTESHNFLAVQRLLFTFYWGPVAAVLLTLTALQFWYARRSSGSGNVS
jgi:membrane protein required for beta-lactamase induction